MTREILYRRAYTDIFRVPSVPSVARSVFGTIGARVQQGQVLTVLDSRGFATAKSELLAAKSREDLNRELLTREESLWRQEIVLEQKDRSTRQAIARILIDTRCSA
jgi:hypothetical protein